MPTRVVINLTEIAHVDDSSVDSLCVACARWAKARVPVTIQAPTLLADALVHRGLQAEVRPSDRAKNIVFSGTLH